MQDDVSPENFSIMREIIEEELRANIDEIFWTFMKSPLLLHPYRRYIWLSLKVEKGLW